MDPEKEMRTTRYTMKWEEGRVLDFAGASGEFRSEVSVASSSVELLQAE
jgi:hypothetical protein